MDNIIDTTQEDFARFYLYCTDWYGPESDHFPYYTSEEILAAVMAVSSRDTQYFTAERIENFPFDGDSMDRWAVRYIMDHKKGAPLAPTKEIADHEQQMYFGQLLSETGVTT